MSRPPGEPVLARVGAAALALLLLAARARAGSCEEIPSLDEDGRSMSGIPVRNQKYAGACYAIAATAVVDAYRWTSLGADRGTRLSPELLWRMENTPNGSNATAAVQHLQAYDGCNELSLYGRKVDISEQFMLDDNVYTAWKCRCDAKDSSGADQPQDLAGFRSDVYAILASAGGQPPRDAGKADRALDELCRFAREPIDRATRDVAMSARFCQVDPVPLAGQLASWQEPDFRNKSVDELNQKLDEVLKSRGLPMVVGLCTVGLLADQAPAAAGQAADACGMHALVIIGRKKRTGPDGVERCMIKLRNSWGTSCASYRAAAKPNCGCADCGPGNVWVEDKDLAPKINTLGYF